MGLGSIVPLAMARAKLFRTESRRRRLKEGSAEELLEEQH